jgi:dihydrolipoamide dehydrogenase
MENFDLIVVGSGPGGYIAAQRAGDLGKKVLLVEKEHLGGVCTNKGCIPTKALLNSAKMYRHALDSEKMGVTAKEVTYDLASAMSWKQDTIETLRGGIAFLMKSAGVTVVNGEATFIDKNRIDVAGKTYSATNIIVATGSSPLVPPIEGSTLEHVVTSDEVLEIKKIPSSIVIIGGGVIGIEFASYFSSIGTKVTVVELLDEILPMMDKDFAKLMRREMKNVDFNLGCKVTKITDDGVIFVDPKGNEQSVAGELVLLSVGRKANLKGVEKLNLETAKGYIVVDENLKTNVDNVWAIGDVNGKSLLAHSASRMAEVVVANLYSSEKQKMRYFAIPWALYGMPEAAGCGLTEQEAIKQNREILVGTTQMRANGRFLAEHGKRASGLCKVVVDKKSKAILGIHLIGPYSSEIIASASVIIESELRIKEVKELIFPHPSVAEILKDTLFAIEKTL